MKWEKDTEEVSASLKYEISEEETSRSLTVKSLTPDDSGTYTCVLPDGQTVSSKLTVKGKINNMYIYLRLT